MNKQTVLGLGVLALILVATAGAPFWFGMETEKAYDKLVQQASKSGRFNVVSKSYNRGWLGSTAVMDVSSPGSPITVSIAHDISHGPIPLQRLLDGEIKFEPVLAIAKSKLTVSITGDNATGIMPALSLPPVTIDTQLQFSGDGKLIVKLEPVNKKLDNGASINWQGLSGTLSFNSDWTEFKTQLQSPGLTIDSANGKFSLSRIILDYNMHEGTAEYLFGGGSLKIAKMDLGAIGSVTGLKLTTMAKPVGSNMTLSAGYDVKNITLANETYGPGQFKFEIRKLDVKTLRQFERDMNKIYKQNMPREQASMIMLGKLMQLAAELSKQVPEIEVTKLSFKTKNGEITGNAKFILDGSNLNVSENPMLLLTAFSGDAEVTIPRDIVKSIVTPLIVRDIETYKSRGAITVQDSEKLTPELINEVVDQAMPLYLPRNQFTRLLVQEGESYKISTTIRGGRVFVNGQPWQGPSPTL